VIRRISLGCARGKETVFQNLKITVTPVLGKDLIGHETRDVHGNVMRQVANLQDQIVRKQLIDAGWTPPGAVAAQAPEEETMGATGKSCWCTTCRPITLEDMRFVVCPTCGNKRCPKANNHSLACSGSNATGQPGSSWEHVQPAAEIGKAMQQEHRGTTP
jgi:hypothetical protein